MEIATYCIVGGASGKGRAIGGRYVFNVSREWMSRFSVLFSTGKSGLAALDFGKDRGAFKQQTWFGISKWLDIWLNGRVFVYGPIKAAWSKAFQPRMLSRRNPLASRISPMPPFGRSSRLVSFDRRVRCVSDVWYWGPIALTAGPPSRAAISSREVGICTVPTWGNPAGSSSYRLRRAGYLSVCQRL